MNNKEEDSESDDHEPTIIGMEDQKIEIQKPPNDRIIHHKMVKENLNSENNKSE